MSNLNKTSQEQIPVLPEVPKEVLANGLTLKYLVANGDQLKVTIKLPADTSYDMVAVRFGTDPKCITVNASLYNNSDTPVIITTREILAVGEGKHLMDYELFKRVGNDTSPRSHSQEITVKDMSN
ncbi:hypothetical protein [Pseudomonas sp. LB1P83]